MPGLLEQVVDDRRLAVVDVSDDREVIREMRESLLGQRALAPHGRVPQFPLHGGDEPREIALDDVVVRTGPHRRDRDVLADRAGDEDEREDPDRVRERSPARPCR